MPRPIFETSFLDAGRQNKFVISRTEGNLIAVITILINKFPTRERRTCPVSTFTGSRRKSCSSRLHAHSPLPPQPYVPPIHTPALKTLRNTAKLPSVYAVRARNERSYLALEKPLVDVSISGKDQNEVQIQGH